MAVQHNMRKNILTVCFCLIMLLPLPVNASEKAANAQLLQAIKTGDSEQVRSLVKLQLPEMKYGNSNEMHPLMMAVREGNIEIVQILIDAGADVNIHGRGNNTPLLIACRSGNIEIVKTLLAARVDLHGRDGEGANALMWSARFGYSSIVELLLKHGANVNAQAENGTTALMLAAGPGRGRVVEMLVSAGADVKARDKAMNTTS